MTMETMISEDRVPPEVGLDVDLKSDHVDEVGIDNGLDKEEDNQFLDDKTEPLAWKRNQGDGDSKLVVRIDHLIRTYYGKPVKHIVREVTENIRTLYSSEKHELNDAERSYIERLILNQPSAYIGVVFLEYAQSKGRKDIIFHKKKLGKIDLAHFFPFARTAKPDKNEQIQKGNNEKREENKFKEEVEELVFDYLKYGWEGQGVLETKLYNLLDEREQKGKKKVVSGRKEISAYATYVEWVLDNLPEFKNNVANIYREVPYGVFVDKEFRRRIEENAFLHLGMDYEEIRQGLYNGVLNQEKNTVPETVFRERERLVEYVLADVDGFKAYIQSRYGASVDAIEPRTLESKKAQEAVLAKGPRKPARVQNPNSLEETVARYPFVRSLQATKAVVEEYESPEELEEAFFRRGEYEAKNKALLQRVADLEEAAYQESIEPIREEQRKIIQNGIVNMVKGVVGGYGLIKGAALGLALFFGYNANQVPETPAQETVAYTEVAPVQEIQKEAPKKYNETRVSGISFDSLLERVDEVATAFSDKKEEVAQRIIRNTPFYHPEEPAYTPTWKKETSKAEQEKAVAEYAEEIKRVAQIAPVYDTASIELYAPERAQGMKYKPATVPNAPEMNMTLPQTQHQKEANQAFGMKMAAFKQKREAYQSMERLLEAYGQSLGY